MNARSALRLLPVALVCACGAGSPTFATAGSSAVAVALPAPALSPPKGYSTFHPMEVMTFNWTAVPGAATYVLQFATDPGFPVLTRGQFDNIPNTTYSFAVGDANEGNYWTRVYAVEASGTSRS